MQRSELLRQLDLGKSVAEFDTSLEKYFIETHTFHDLINNRGDIIAGDKGTGKTALFQILANRYRQISELTRVEVLAAFNPSGSPVFQRLAEKQALTEGQYITVWKTYLLSLVGNWILEIYEGSHSEDMKKLDDLLKKLDLRSPDATANTIFSKIVNWLKALVPKSASAEITFNAEGIPVISPKVEFDKQTTSRGAHEGETIAHEYALSLLNRILDAENFSVWLVLDRLDEAFQGFPTTELPALRALFRTYLDMTAFNRIRLKLFVRKDLFRRIIAGGFVNLTHINSRKIEITWDEADLANLLYQRIKENRLFLQNAGLAEATWDEIFAAVFPPQVDGGERKTTTWKWMMSRIRDGNDLKPPRNLLDLVAKAQDAQLRREARGSSEYNKTEPLIGPESIKKGLSALSEERVQDTLLAEAADNADLILKFRDGKSEHNLTSIAQFLGSSEVQVKDQIKSLMEIGFLAQIGESYKIPILYRDGLRITQGKAF